MCRKDKKNGGKETRLFSAGEKPGFPDYLPCNASMMRLLSKTFSGEKSFLTSLSSSSIDLLSSFR
ncbi:MAG: hypothetical protein DRI57_30705 [Deltaproteobacteria bacterium]|nr:MAG: hypothetical protein DRI57_30705 [Deltaproteobacteria bacterium]